MSIFGIVNNSTNIIESSIVADDLDTAKSFLGNDATQLPDLAYTGCWYDKNTGEFKHPGQLNQEGN